MKFKRKVQPLLTNEKPKCNDEYTQHDYIFTLIDFARTKARNHHYGEPVDSIVRYGQVIKADIVEDKLIGLVRITFENQHNLKRHIITHSKAFVKDIIRRTKN